MNIKEGFVELSGRERVKAILEQGSFRELISPFDKMKSPHLMAQGIVPQNDDGMIVAKGVFAGEPALVIAMEGNFQGGGIGEISGAKFAGALELALQDWKQGKKLQPIILFDTGGVRLQEANYGLLAISEIQSALVELRDYCPVIGVISGPIGCFGGMSMTAALFSYLIMTKQGRLTLNGPEVIEQEAGIEEWDSSDKSFTFNTIGGKNRVATGFADILVEDSVEDIKLAIGNCMRKGIPIHRSSQIKEYRELLWPKAAGEKLMEPSSKSRGRVWFNALLGDKGADNTRLSSILCGNTLMEGRKVSLLSVVPDENTYYERSKKGEVGLQQGFELAQCIEDIINEDKDTVKKPIIAIVDVPSQAYGYKEELKGIFLSCASSVGAYVKARLSGHPVITVIVGNAISGAFLAHGLQGSYMISLEDETIMVHAMSKKSAARITKRSISDMDNAASIVPGIAYDIESFNCLGAVNQLLQLQNHNEPTKEDIEVMKHCICQGVEFSKAHNNQLSYRLETDNGKKYRGASIDVRRRLYKQWN